MGKNFLEKIIEPILRVNLVIQVILALVLTYLNVKLGVVAFLIIIVLAVYYRKYAENKGHQLKEYADNITEEMDDSSRQFVAENPLPICMIDRDGAILWINHKFRTLFPQVELFNTNIQVVTNVKHSEFLPEDEVDAADSYVTVSTANKVYRIITSRMSDSDTRLLYWQDVTNWETLKSLYRDERPCTAYLSVDNYDDLVAATPDNKRSELAAQIEKMIRQWAAHYNASILRYSRYQYHLVFETRYYEKMEMEKFSILDEIRNIETEADFPVSVSIGVGVGAKSYDQLDEYAAAAMDLALGRGGDQAVIKKMNSVEYYGGRLQAIEKRNKGKSRIMAHALRPQIDQASNVIIMGHKRPDMDCFGASLGIHRMAVIRNKTAAVVINGRPESLDRIYDKAVGTGMYNFVSSEQALDMVNKDTLLVVVDTHRPKLTECPELLTRTEKIVVIDHHRRSEDAIENPMLTYMESYASSASELVAEILQYYTEKKSIDKMEAEALLAGIMLDTNHFSVKSGVRTFEAAGWLRRNGADITNVRQFFRIDVSFFKQKAALISSAQITGEGIAVAWTEDRDANMQVIAAQAADELLTIKGVRASFVAGINSQGITVISGRSLGELNVQTILEKMGGGGHLTTAGAQVVDPPAQAIMQIEDIISNLNK
ncbi:MAG: DHH family phosphoesterase [Firmicutes bacterium]|nr:DHH family phosphoesterase [Bacillota bacterium]